MSSQVIGLMLLKRLIGLEGLIEFAHFDKSLAPHTSFRIGGNAQIMLTPRTELELKQSLLFCRQHHIEPLILGGGSNLLIVKDVLPVVISLCNFKDMLVLDETVYAGAGAMLSSLVTNTVKRGLGGLEALTGIPGTIGGALAGNSGGKWEGKAVDIGDFVTEVRVLDKDGETHCLSKNQIQFGYRSSSLNRYIIVGAAFQFKPAPLEELKMRCLASFRQKKASQPLNARSAGCIFKNPPEAPAWKLIQQAGLVGTKIGAAMVSNKHANFIVNLGGATGEDVCDLIMLICRQVKSACGIDLKLEVKLW